jgi:lipopolysaccharide/colanic/teichoic acid biosynthesis glycosyltransferase
VDAPGQVRAGGVPAGELERPGVAWSPGWAIPSAPHLAAYEVAKRALDLLVSVMVLLLMSPAILVIALAVKLDSPGPSFFVQTRLGRGAHPFRIIKFRTMRIGATDTLHQEYVVALIEGRGETKGSVNGRQVYKLVDDERVSRIGRLLRRTSLDELPQLVNVLLGSMSLVGPRPPLHYEVDRYGPRPLGRLAVKPGLTGLWQVSGRNALSFDRMIELDLQYVERRSFGLDLWILARTIPAVLFPNGA